MMRHYSSSARTATSVRRLDHRSGRRDVRSQHLHDFRLGHGAHPLVHNLAAFKQQERGDPGIWYRMAVD